MKNKKGTIQAIVKYFYPVTAGIEVNMLETYSILAKNGWDVTIHTSSDTYKERNILPIHEEIRDLKVKRYNFRKFGFFPKIDWRLPDLVCLHNFDMFPHFQILFYSYLRKIFKKDTPSFVLTPHGGYSLDEAWSVFPLWQRIIKGLYNATLGKFLINKVVSGIRAVSEWEKQDLIKRGIKPELISVITNGLEKEAFLDVEKLAGVEIKKKVRHWGKYILQIGRIYPIKNYETTIKALKEIPSDVKFVIVGPVEKNKNPKYLDYLENLTKDLGLENRVVFAGVIRGVDKYYVIKKAEMMVHMALWESFCNVVHEAMSQGLPCIVANNTALPLLIKNDINGFCVETKDYKSVAEKINYVLKNKNSTEIKKMTEINRKFGLEESWEKVAEKMDHLYSKLI